MIKLENKNLQSQKLPAFFQSSSMIDEKYIDKMWPCVKSLSWRGSEINQLKKKSFSYEDKVTDPFKQELLDLNNSVVFSNGNYQKKFFVNTKEIEVSSVKDLKEEIPELKHIDSSFKEKGFFYELNRQFLNDGVLIRVKKDIKNLNLFHFLQSVQSEIMTNACVFIILEPKVKLSLLESNMSEKSKEMFSNLHSFFYLKKQSSLEWVKVNRLNSDINHLNVSHVYQKDHSYFKGICFSLGGKWNREEIKIQLDGERAECDVQGLVHFKKNDCSEITVETHHLKPQTKSNVSFKSLLKEKAKLCFNGFVKIHLEGSQSDASLVNKNLFLGEQVKVSTQPNLEVMTDDVKRAVHGCTTGKLNDLEKFYLGTRGISEEKFYKMILKAQMQSLLFQIENKETAKKVEKILENDQSL